MLALGPEIQSACEPPFKPPSASTVERRFGCRIDGQRAALQPRGPIGSEQSRCAQCIVDLLTVHRPTLLFTRPCRKQSDSRRHKDAGTVTKAWRNLGQPHFQLPRIANALQPLQAHYIRIRVLNKCSVALGNFFPARWVPSGVSGPSYNILESRVYILCASQWFRTENSHSQTEEPDKSNGAVGQLPVS